MLLKNRTAVCVLEEMHKCERQKKKSFINEYSRQSLKHHLKSIKNNSGSKELPIVKYDWSIRSFEQVIQTMPKFSWIIYGKDISPFFFSS